LPLAPGAVAAGEGIDRPLPAATVVAPEAPTTAVSPERAMEMPKKSPPAPSPAVSICCWLQLSPLRPNS
jgi:hypothetical protein